VSPPHFLPIELSGGAWAPQTVSSDASTSTRFTSTFGGLALCPLQALTRPPGRGITFILCGGASVGIVGSTGQGFSPSHSDSKPTVDLVLDAHLVFPLAGPVGVRAGGTLALPIVWNDYVYTDSQGTPSVFSPSRLAPMLDAGLAVTLP
jgi:hypothetical protein